MTISRNARLAAVAMVGALALAACGSDGGTDSSASPNASSDTNCVTGALKASGSSAQKNAMAEWINAYQAACGSGTTIDYQANGSGAGIQDFINKQTAFAGSDSALKEEDKKKADARCATGPAIDIPMLGGAIVAAYNLPGVDKLILTSDVLSGIFGNTITKWNDAKISGLNPGVTLPDATIAQFHRSDSSGTTDNWTKFLKGTSAAWTFDSGKEWKAPGGQGSKGSDGVATSVKSTENSIGYVELSFAQDAKLGTAWIDNGSGTAIEPTSENAAKTIAAATVKGTGNDLALSVDYKSAAGYPAVLVTYQITCEKGGDAALVPLTKSFLAFTASDAGQAQLIDIGYVPITGDLLTKVRAAVESITA